MNEAERKDRFKEYCQNLAKELGLEMYDLEYLGQQSLLRVFIRNPETKTAVIEDCVKFDQGMTSFVEESEWIPDTFQLEVSSPGIERHLSEDWHFQEAVGETICLQLKQKWDADEAPKKLRNQKKLSGVLRQFIDGRLLVELEEKEFEFKKEEIKKANIEYLGF